MPQTPESYEFDAIVIGSGISGGWAAKELCEKGMKVLMLDRGYAVEHGNYLTEGKAPFEMPFQGSPTPPAETERDHFISKWGGGDSQDSKHYFNNDRLNPYAYDEGKAFRWIRPAAVGGKSLMWGRVSLRWSAMDFEANKTDGYGNDWPIRYDDIAPWYSYVEKFAGIAGSKENLPQLPDSEFQPPHPMNAAEAYVKEKLEAAMPGRKLINSRTSNMSQDKPEQGRSRCQSRDQCARGCSFGAYFSSHSSTLPAARATGNFTLLADQVVTSLDYDPKTRRVTGVRAIDTKTGHGRVFRSRIVFLCASAMASTQILLNSKLDGSEKSFADDSDTLGRYIMDHIFRAGASAEVPGLEQYIAYGRMNGGIYIPRFRNIGETNDDVPFKRGYGMQGGAGRSPVLADGFGAGMKHAMRKYGPWKIGVGAFGECLPYRDNTLTLHRSKTDRFGVPLAVFNVTFRDNEYAMMQDAVDQAKLMFEKAGLTNIQGGADVHVPGDAIHEVGGARMGNTPQDSVLNKWSQAHAAANLFVTDGAQMASVSCVNPSLTFMALTARAADYAVKQVRAGAI